MKPYGEEARRNSGGVCAGGGGLEYKKGGGARHLAWGVNFRFWSHLGC